MQQKIHDIIFNTDDITWKAMLFEVIKKDNMNPWDIEVKVIADKFIELLKQFKKMDFKISGKVILASAILLKMKSDKFLKDDFSRFDQLIEESTQTIDDDTDDFNYTRPGDNMDEKPLLVPRTPQPRTRKVSIFDLVNALEQALEVKERRTNRLSMLDAPDVVRPTRKFDITKGISELHSKLLGIFSKKNSRINFVELVPGDSKEDKIYTFIPLLHLSNQRKVDLFQEEHFGNIEVEILNSQQTPVSENQDTIDKKEIENPISIVN